MPHTHKDQCSVEKDVQLLSLLLDNAAVLNTGNSVQPFGLRSHCGYGEGAQQQARCRNSFPRRHRLTPALPYRATLSSLGSQWFLVSFLIEHGPGLLTGTSDLKAATPLENLITAWVNRWSV